MVNAASQQSNALAGIVVFSARTNQPLLTCALESTGSSSFVVGLKARDAYRGAGPFSSSDTGPWAGGATLQLLHTSGQTTNGWTCAGRATGGGQAWASVTTTTTVSDSVLDSFAEGDLYYGLVGQVC